MQLSDCLIQCRGKLIAYLADCHDNSLSVKVDPPHYDAFVSNLGKALVHLESALQCVLATENAEARHLDD